MTGTWQSRQVVVTPELLGMRSTGECQQRAEKLGLTPLPWLPTGKSIGASTSCSRGRAPMASIVCRGSDRDPRSAASPAGLVAQGK